MSMCTHGGGGEKRAGGEGKLSGFSFIHLITISNIVTKVYLKGPHTIHSFKFHKENQLFIQNNRIPMHCVRIFFSLKDFLFFCSVGSWHSGMFL